MPRPARTWRSPGWSSPACVGSRTSYQSCTSSEGDPAELDEKERGRLGIRPLPGSLEEALDALESDEVVRSWFSKDLLDCYLGMKRTEISLLDGADPQEACERYLRVY